MERRLVVVAGVAAIAFVLLTRVAAADPVQMWHEPTRTLGGNSDAVVAVPSGEVLPRNAVPFLPIEDNTGRSFEVPFSVADLMLLLTLITVFAGIMLWRYFRDPDQEPIEALAEMPATLADVVPGLEHLLSSGAPRDAIVACWVELESRVEWAGLPRDRAETSTEFTERVLVTYTVDHGAIHKLAALYREARFSTHQLSERHRESAVVALGELEAQLARPAKAARIDTSAAASP